MKRFLPLLLAALVLLCACTAGGGGEIESPFVFYYRAVEDNYGTQNGPMYPQTVSLDVSQVTLRELLDQYRSTTPAAGASQPVPESWALSTATLEGATASVTFAGSSSVLTEVERSILNACIARTLLQLPDVLRVSITIPGSTAATVLTSSDLLLWDSALNPQEEIILYFPDAERRYLVRQRQTVSAMTTADKAEYIVHQLLNPEAIGQEHRCIPSGTSLLSLRLENGLCTVDLSSHFINGMEQSFVTARMAVYSIVNSLTELPEIHTVDLYVAGAPLEQLGLLEFSGGLTRDESLLAAAAGSESKDITLYPASGSAEKLVSIPCRVEPREDVGLEELVLNALISYEGRDGIRSYIPQGTKLLSLRIEDGVCTVDLTGEFLPAQRTAAEELLAVRSLIATMYALDGIEAVEILVEGMAPDYLSSSLNNIRQPSQRWFAE